MFPIHGHPSAEARGLYRRYSDRRQPAGDTADKDCTNRRSEPRQSGMIQAGVCQTGINGGLVCRDRRPAGEHGGDYTSFAARRFQDRRDILQSACRPAGTDAVEYARSPRPQKGERLHHHIGSRSRTADLRSVGPDFAFAANSEKSLPYEVLALFRRTAEHPAQPQDQRRRVGGPNERLACRLGTMTHGGWPQLVVFYVRCRLPVSIATGTGEMQHRRASFGRRARQHACQRRVNRKRALRRGFGAFDVGIGGTIDEQRRVKTLHNAYSNEAGRVSRSYVGHTFQLDRGHRSNLIAAR